MEWLMHNVLSGYPSPAWLESVSDVAIGIACLSIPVALATLVRRRRDMDFGWVFWLFAAFVALCGLTRCLDALTIWAPGWERFSGAATFVAAVVSVTVAAVAWPLLSHGVAFPTVADMSDATQRLERETAVREESEARYRFLYHHTPAPLHVLGTDGRLQGVSDYWLELLGYDRHEVVGRSISDFYVPGFEDDYQNGLESLNSGFEIRGAERRMIRRDGSIINILISVTPERATDGSISRHLGVLLDVTERDRAQENLRSSQERLLAAQRLESIGRLTGGVAHDFNNMLAVITGCLESMRSKLPEDRPDLRRIVDSCLEAAFRSAALTAQLLSVARRQSLEPQPLDPVEVVEGILVLLERAVGESVELSLPRHVEGTWSCMADRSQLESALLNLVINARDAVGAQGMVSVEIIETHVGIDPVDGAEDTLPSGDYVHLRVTDDGSGMSAETRRRALEPFYTTKPMGGGTGLGLSQVHGFARQSGGTISICTQEGVGTTVGLLLPRAAHVAAPTGDAASDMPVPAMPGETVFLVEDEPSIRYIAEEILVDLGYAVKSAPDGCTALAMLRAGEAPDILLTDIQMPGGIDGIELALRAREILPGLPVLFCSGNDGGPDSRARSVPGAGLLRKPYRGVQMAAAVRETIDRSRRVYGLEPH